MDRLGERFGSGGDCMLYPVPAPGLPDVVGMIEDVTPPVGGAVFVPVPDRADLCTSFCRHGDGRRS